MAGSDQPLDDLAQLGGGDHGSVVTRNQPADIQRELFASAASLSEPVNATVLKEQIARFLHSHKNV